MAPFTTFPNKALSQCDQIGGIGHSSSRINQPTKRTKSEDTIALTNSFDGTLEVSGVFILCAEFGNCPENFFSSGNQKFPLLQSPVKGKKSKWQK